MKTKSPIPVRPDETFFQLQHQQINRLLQRIDAAQEQINLVARRTARDAIEVGVRLGEVKSRMKSHQFGEFRRSLNLPYNSAFVYLKVGERFGYLLEEQNPELLRNFQVSALQILAADCVPQEKVEQAINFALAGEPVTHAVANEIVGSCRKSTRVANQKIPLRLRKSFQQVYLQVGEEKLTKLFEDLLNAHTKV